MSTCVFINPKSDGPEFASSHIEGLAEKFLGFKTGRVRSGRVLELGADLNEDEQSFVKTFLIDSVVQEAQFSKSCSHSDFASYCVVSKKPGITDDEARCAEKAYEDRFEQKSPPIFSHELYMFEQDLPEEALESLATTLLGNPLIHTFSFGKHKIEGPFSRMTSDASHARSHEQRKIDPYALALNNEEVQAIEAHFSKAEVLATRSEKGLSELSDCEWEILAQTWSEHCKHKEFNAEIHYRDLDTGETRVIDSLFKSKIKKATDLIDETFCEKGNSFLVKVFNDNAGIVKIDEESHFVWKVETHNTPSALDPYGGAMTGVLGVNRDAFGTGLGGARLLFNTNVLCFGSPDYSKPLLKGQKHPRYIRSGVVRGVRDAGNHSGVPTVNGAVLYDDRYSGKPLVFCGTGAVLPKTLGGAESWKKRVEPGDRILMVGGRVGKDGIHGATASSTHADDSTPATIVQIGSPLTQKLLSDFLERITREGLVKTCTDNGAGGLSSSIGELAEIAGGALVHLEKVPLKYPGLEPWEIFVSESQERMTLVCDPKHVCEILKLAQTFEVEATDVGEFTKTGFLDVRFGDFQEAYLDLNFLHGGVPKKVLYAEWSRPHSEEPVLAPFESFNKVLLDLLASDNICSRRAIIRQYDHEVKARSVVKPLMGKNQTAPQDAAVLRLDFNSHKGIAVSNGILPKYGDLDPYEMSAASFDEAVRQILAVGGRLPDPEDADPVFWSVNDNFCVPNVVYDAESNPDGKFKLAKLVRMCDALYDMSTFFKIPMTSGKDSMKNDFGVGRDKISVPPTILFSMASRIDDVRKVVTTEWKQAGDAIYVLGQTYNELGGSEFYKLFGRLGANVPKIRIHDAKRLYTKFSEAHRSDLIKSAHDLSDGGLGVALAECSIGGALGADIELGEHSLALEAFLFSETQSRFLVSVARENRRGFEAIFGSDAYHLGFVMDEPFLHIKQGSQTLLHTSVEQMTHAWERDLVWSV